MTTTLSSDRNTRSTGLGLRWAAVAGATLALGLLAPAAAAAGPAVPPQPEGPDDLGIEQPCQPDLCEPEPPDPECPPFVATCDDLVFNPDPGDPDPDPDPEDPEGPGPTDPEPTSDSGEPSPSVDAPVHATPTFTG
jgi:hypothetical protein